MTIRSRFPTGPQLVSIGLTRSMTLFSVRLTAIFTGARSTFDQEAIQEWLLELESAGAEGKIAIALEQRRGGYFQLCTHLGWIDL
jgi:hypothetical protein